MINVVIFVGLLIFCFFVLCGVDAIAERFRK